MLIPGYTVFRGDAGPHHLQRIELAGYLEQRPRILWHLVHLARRQ